MGQGNLALVNGDLGWQVPCTCLILDLIILSKFGRWEEEEPKFAPILKLSFNIQRAKELLIKYFLKEGSNPRFDPFLRDFIDKSNAFGPSNTLLEQLGGSGSPCWG